MDLIISAQKNPTKITKGAIMEKYGVVTGESEPKEESLEDILKRQKEYAKKAARESSPAKPRGPSKYRVKR